MRVEEIPGVYRKNVKKLNRNSKIGASLLEKPKTGNEWSLLRKQTKVFCKTKRIVQKRLRKNGAEKKRAKRQADKSIEKKSEGFKAHRGYVHYRGGGDKKRAKKKPKN